jgi:hypothetical protein
MGEGVGERRERARVVIVRHILPSLSKIELDQVGIGKGECRAVHGYEIAKAVSKTHGERGLVLANGKRVEHAHKLRRGGCRRWRR